MVVHRALKWLQNELCRQMTQIHVLLFFVVEWEGQIRRRIVSVHAIGGEVIVGLIRCRLEPVDEA